MLRYLGAGQVVPPRCSLGATQELHQRDTGATEAIHQVLHSCYISVALVGVTLVLLG